MIPTKIGKYIIGGQCIYGISQLNNKTMKTVETFIADMHTTPYKGVTINHTNNETLGRAIYTLDNNLLNEGFQVAVCYAHPKGDVFKIDNLDKEKPYTAILNMDCGELTSVSFEEAIEYITTNGKEY